MQVNILEAKNRLSELIRSVMSGEQVVIANRGKPVVRLVAEPDAETCGGSGRAEGVLDWLERNPLPAHAARSPEEIEADIQAERAGWD